MNKKQSLVLVIVLVLIAATGIALTTLKSRQRLGKPGIRATPIPDTVVMNFDLPADVPGFTSSNLPQSEVVLGYLPKDTSFAQRRYTASDGFWVVANIILMGADRTSIHKADLCLPGQGWRIIDKSSPAISIKAQPSYQMPVAKWVISNFAKDPDGRKKEIRGLYVFWFVADNEQTVSNDQRIWWLVRDLVKTGGILQRWAYVSYFCMCAPGQEDATFERVKKLIAFSVPEFQLPPTPESPAAVAKVGSELVRSANP